MKLKNRFLIFLSVFVDHLCIFLVKSQCLYYKVQNGDTFESIAQAYAYAGVSVPVLASYNPGINSGNVQLYNYICIPIASINPSVKNNPMTVPIQTTTPVPSISGTCSNNYVIQSGNTCYGIATQYGVTLQSLLQANPYVNCYNLQIGSALCIPAVTSSLTTCSRSYTIATGDYCNIIATRLGTSVANIYHCNPHVVIGCTNLFPGQVIKY
jgi:LysM repeat protein